MLTKDSFKKRLVYAFNRWAKEYETEVVPKLIRRGYSYSVLANLIISQLCPKEGAQVAEIGVGSGVLGKHIKMERPDLNIVGFDISDVMLSKAKHTNAYVDLIQCDAQHIPVINSSCPLIFSAFMLHSALSIPQYINEFRRIGGNSFKIVIADLFRSKRRIPIFSYVKDNIHSFKHEYGAPSNYSTVEEIVKTIREMNIKIVESKQLDTVSDIEKKSSGSMVHYLLSLESI